MSAFVAALRDFIARDLMFLLGGSLVIASLLYAISLLETVTSNIYVLILIGGIAYVLGWVIQDVFCIIGLVTVQPYHSPKRFYLWLYKRLLGDEWEVIDPNSESLRDRKVRVYEKASQRNLIEIERFVALKQVASTISPSSLIASIILFVHFIVTSCESIFSLAGAIVLLILAVLLIPLNRIKAAQQAQYVWKLSNHLQDSDEAG